MPANRIRGSASVVQQRDPKAYQLFTSKEFNVPRVLPDGNYTGPAKR